VLDTALRVTSSAVSYPLGTVGPVELTAEQQRVVDHRGGPLRVGGGPGTGRTTALVARYLALVQAGAHRPSAVLVVCHDRAAATRFRDAVLPHLRGGFDALPLTTWFGVAFDLVSRHRGGPVRVLSRSEQRGVVRRLLEQERADDWPVFGRFLGRDAFAEEVAAAVLGQQTANGAGAGGGELGRFAERYARFLGERGQVDSAGLLAAATRLAERGRYEHILVDDHRAGSPGSGLLAALAGPGTGLALVCEQDPAWPADDIVLTQSFRRPAAPVLVTCPHPSTEAEAVARELSAARADGIPWSAMAVLVRESPARGRGIARALGRHGIPVAPGPGLGTGLGDPAVAAIVDLLRWSTGDERVVERLLVSPLSGLGPDGLRALRDEVDAAARVGPATPADLAFTVWERGLGHLVGGRQGDDTSLDAVVGFVDRLARRAEHDPAQDLRSLLAELDDDAVEPDPWRVAHAGSHPEAVTVTSIAAARGREWHTVVVAGCVEGELPRIRGRAPLFDPVPRSPAERRQESLAEERRLFRTACSRATGRLVATAAPSPGVLLSRFVEGWDRSEARPPLLRGPMPVARRATATGVAVFPDGELVLSASQLATYDDCPLRYAYQYGLRVRDEAGAPAALGSLVHEVLAEFLDPAGLPAGLPDGPPRSRERLLALAAERWRDDIARYRPQVEECRRDYFSMLEAWWAAEGDGPLAPEVLAVERRFDIDVGGVRLVGTIDRIDRIDRAAGGEGIRIVDYKTGRNEPRPDAMPDDLQLAIYHLAATRDPELAALGPPRQLQLLYLRTMHRFEQPLLEGHAEATEARVLQAAAAIRAERFEPAVDASCRTCPFWRLCPLQAEGREVGAA
jgi:superfamily I DNA/RNA helicase/RecB family exonuclease